MADTHIRTYQDKRHINLTAPERTELAERLQIESAIAMFLDLEQDRTWRQIADAMGISISELKRMTRKPEFQRIYDETTVALGHDPRLQAVVSQLPDLLPVAFTQLRRILTAVDTRDDVRLKAILEVMKMNKVGEDQATEDPMELSNFLRSNNVQVKGDVIMNMGVPPEYAAAFRKFTGTDIVNVEVHSLDTAAAPGIASVVPVEVSAPPEPESQ